MVREEERTNAVEEENLAKRAESHAEKDVNLAVI